MFEVPYYHELIKKVTIGFGALFSQVKVIRSNPNNPAATPQVVNVPIAYGPKEKFITRIEQDPNLTGHVYITLPRMAFEITGYSYDPSRMVNRSNKIQCKNDSGVTSTYSPVPYNIDFQLSILTKGTEDALAIIEQILPIFTPEYSLSVNAIPELNIVQDIPIILGGVSVSDDYEGDFSIRRLVTHTLTFTAKLNLFGQLTSNGVILQTNAVIPNLNAGYYATMDADGNIIVDRWGDANTNNKPLSGNALAEVDMRVLY
jgi:T4-like virus Myoviridae tail sheath stabiliser